MLHQKVVSYFRDINRYEIARMRGINTRGHSWLPGKIGVRQNNLALWAGYDNFASTYGTGDDLEAGTRLVGAGRCQDVVHRTGQSLGEWLKRAL